VPEGLPVIEPGAPAGAPPPRATAPGLGGRILHFLGGTGDNVVAYFRGHEPRFRHAFAPALVVATLLYTRSPLSNYIFDEQEALLANPYVNGNDLGFLDAFKRDFWGLPPDRSIGSYRPLPNLVWRVLWHLSSAPFLHHLVNVVVHALNAAILASFVFAVTRRQSLGWLAGGVFVCTALLTEAVSGVVGIADVFGGLGVLLALQSLRLGWLAPLGVFGGLAVGLLSKESAIVGVPLIAWSALVLAPTLHPGRPARLLRCFGATLGAVAALVGYTYLRRALFPVSLPEDLLQPLPASEPVHRRALHAFLRWFQQPHLPNDRINNPLIEADMPHRIAGALRVYARGLGQLLFPLRLSGDYSFAAEPVPKRLIFPESVIGGVWLVVAPLVGIALFVGSLVREAWERKRGTFADAPSLRFVTQCLLAVALLWIPVAYFPHSNIPVLLPTVRAERFWYLPAVGASFVLAPAISWLLGRFRSRYVLYAVVAWFSFQAVRARLHALDYTDDLAFWRATKNAVPDSAKAHLNYSVMVGARGDLQERLRENRRALEIAPKWPMAHVYLGDTLCRLHRPAEAWPAYVRGFELGPNDPNLIALALQCLWDEKWVELKKDELLELSERHPGSWLAYLASDIVHNGKEHGGVQPKYRPRSYDGGPKED
jgi:tetratricopeptide (TPR) repeat protein